MKTKVLSIFGTRPEAIKMAPIVAELRRQPDEIDSRVCVTAQHRQMLDQVLGLFDLEADYDLNVMRDCQTPTQVAACVLKGVEPILKKERPDWVLVQGDTTTVMAAALAAFHERIPVGHVEAGLRTYDKWQPFPEEVNRCMTALLADVHFAPTETARTNLLKMGIKESCILVTGNPVIDALRTMAERPFNLCRILPREADLDNKAARLILVTAHRRENLGRPLENICLALQDLASQLNGQLHIVYPVHLNPLVQQTVRPLLEPVPNIHLTPPLDYLPLVQLMKRADLVLTDSGGLQEEAPELRKPVLVLRDVTERPEAVNAGTALLVGTDRKKIVQEVLRLLHDPQAYEAMASAANPYGDGQAADRIVQHILGREVDPWVP